MRLHPQEILALRDILKNLDPTAKLYLYGSRTNDNAKGGDIDLLILSDTLSYSDKITFQIEAKMRLGPQKIDVLISSQEQDKQTEFTKHILPSAIEL